MVAERIKVLLKFEMDCTTAAEGEGSMLACSALPSYKPGMAGRF